MALPPNIATPTLVTGKTNQSQVVDVYENNAAVKDGAAQNSISSVLSGAVNSLFGNTAKGVFKVLESDKFTKDMGGLIRKAVKGDLNSNTVKETLREYKNGALSSILEANGIKDVKLLKDNILKDVGNTVKGIAFGSVKGVVDNVAPGILDEVGIKSFDDCKNVYDQTAAEIRSLKDINSNDVRAFIGDNLELTMNVSSTVLGSCVDIINTILTPEERITDISDSNIDNAILVSATTPLIEEDNAVMNEYILDSFGDDEKKLMDFITAMLPKAVERGAYRFINKAAVKTSKENVSWAIGSSSQAFLSKVEVKPLPSNSQSRNATQEEIINCLEMVSWTPRVKFNVGSFSGITDSVYEVLKYGSYANLATLARTAQPLSATTAIQSNYADFIIT